MKLQYVVYDWSYQDYHDLDVEQDRLEKGRFETAEEALDYKHQVEKVLQEKGMWYAHEVDVVVEEVS